MRGIAVTLAPGLKVSFSVDGEAKFPPAAAPRFVDNLWQRTCFEVFAARNGAPEYREFNLSPSGEYAAYEFLSYRDGMTPLPVQPRIRFSGTMLEATIPLERGPWRVGLSAVIEEDDGTVSYWALHHPPGRPDFHHPDAFALELP
ncbi:MAG TPA: DOMON-like domain-containing protein [Burkholderiales bacterium]|nr:DOMON-like domain-containing protein [Burkholderiales bacterium]